MNLKKQRRQKANNYQKMVAVNACFWVCKNSASNFREKIIKLFKTKIDNNIPTNCKPKTIAGVFDDKYIK